ncbi:MAG: bile acid:sodium symporter family protein [Bacteroidetes bacterium]|jgi:bile acid:Na+ symporter, BASS family|nr:bile acid:sodium symporter family protein [Bacteroidota bacterium]MBT4401200.1 bile acid:sodium symporter family protein [Bacteroidota bacterium]MBT7463482.1 bile acid:sodium symporter family protein [Bacteroidota bacterium]
MDQLSAIILAGSLTIIMLGMGLSLTFADFKRIFVYPKAVFIGLGNQLIILPLVGFGVAVVFPLRPEVAVGIMILAACPGGPTSNLIAHLAKGDTALSVTLTSLSSFVTIISIPFIVNFALVHFLDQGQIIKLDILQTIIQIFVIIVIPVTIGMVIRYYKNDFANKMAKPVRIASGIVMALVIIGLFIKERENFIPYFKDSGLATLTLNIVTMLIGFLSALLFKIKRKAALSISIESGIQNGTLAITIAVVLLNNSEFAIAPAIYSLLMFFTGGAVIYLGLRQSRKRIKE